MLSFHTLTRFAPRLCVPESITPLMVLCHSSPSETIWVDGRAVRRRVAAGQGMSLQPPLSSPSPGLGKRKRERHLDGHTLARPDRAAELTRHRAG